MSYFRSLCPGFRGKSVFSVSDGRTSLEYFYMDLTALPLDSVLNHNDLLIATSDPTYKCQCVFVIPSTPEVWCFALLWISTIPRSIQTTTRQPSLSVYTVSKTLILFNITEVCIYCRKTGNIKKQKNIYVRSFHWSVVSVRTCPGLLLCCWYKLGPKALGTERVGLA